MSVDEAKEKLLPTVDEGDTFIDEFGKLNSDNHTLTDKEKQALKVAIAIAQAGYIQGQPFRAKEEDPTSKKRRFDRDQYALNPQMRKNIYNTAMKASNDELASTLRVGFEVAKDVKMLKDARSATIAP